VKSTLDIEESDGHFFICDYEMRAFSSREDVNCLVESILV